MTWTPQQLDDAVAAQADDVARAAVVGPVEPDAATVPSTSRLTQSYRTTVEDLWDAVTSPRRLPRWFAPVSGDLRLGGRYQVEGNAGGTVTACDPPRSFAVTWEFGGGSSEVVVEVTPDGVDRARLTLTHAGHTPRDFFDSFGPGATGVGWDLALLGLRLHLTTGSDKPVEMTEWESSPSAKAFVTACAERWGDAAVAAGQEDGAARAAQDATAAFYRGDAPSEGGSEPGDADGPTA